MLSIGETSSERRCAMALQIRKLVIVSVIAAVILLANVRATVDWLDDVGLVGWARNLRAECLTGTALAVIAVLLVLVPAAGVRAGGLRKTVSRCPVCDHMLARQGRYCGECGSRVTD